MAIKLYLDKRSALQDGTYPVKVGISYMNKYVYLPMGIRLQESQFDVTGGKNGTTWVKNHPSKEMYNRLIMGRLVKIDEVVISLHGRKADLKKEILSRLNPIEEEEETVISFHSAAESCINTEEGRTREMYINTYNKVCKYCDPHKLTMDILDVDWIEGFEAFLHDQGNAVNTIAIEMRNIRHIFRYAIKKDRSLAIYYPFSSYTIKREQTPDLSLSYEQLLMLRDFPGNQKQRDCIEYFFIMFYLIGINIGDLCEATHDDVVDGRLLYERNKTGKNYSIKLYPEAIELIHKHEGKSYLIDALDRYKSYKDFLKMVNKTLKGIGREIEKQLIQEWEAGGKQSIRPSFPEVTSYWARYSWANIAHRAGVQKDYISMGLGHSFGVRVTDTYLYLNLDFVDEANRKVIDYMNGVGL